MYIAETIERLCFHVLYRETSNARQPLAVFLSFYTNHGLSFNDQFQLTFFHGCHGTYTREHAREHAQFQVNSRHF